VCAVGGEVKTGYDFKEYSITVTAPRTKETMSLAKWLMKKDRLYHKNMEKALGRLMYNKNA
jgi:hypothetical protein